MVKKLKRFVVFCLFSMFFSLLGGKSKVSKIVEVKEAEAKCCPLGSVSLDKFGNCLTTGGIIVDESCY